MPTFIALINFTEQGIKTIRDWDKRVAQGRKNTEALGGKLIDAYLTLGDVDAVVIQEYPDDETVLKGAIAYALGGNGRSRTLRAYTESEAMSAIRGLPSS